MVNRTRNPHRGGNFTRGPHLGGVPKGTSWTRAASDAYVKAVIYRHTVGCDLWLSVALQVIRDHTRSATTRAEAARLISVLESRS